MSARPAIVAGVAALAAVALGVGHGPDGDWSLALGLVVTCCATAALGLPMLLLVGSPGARRLLDPVIAVALAWVVAAYLVGRSAESFTTELAAVAAAAAAAAFLGCRMRLPREDWLGGRPWGIAAAALIGLSLPVVLQAIEAHVFGRVGPHLVEGGWAWVPASVVLCPIAEEFLFRGVLWRPGTRALDNTVAVGAGSVAIHLGHWTASYAPLLGFENVPHWVAFAAAVGWARARWGLLAAIAMHAAANAAIGLGWRI